MSSLPKLNSAVYELTIPSTKQKVKFRPYLVKEQKSLMIAQESDEVNVMVNTLKQVIKDCVLDDIDVDSLAVFDIEYLFLQIRSKSSGEDVQLEFTCPQCQEQKTILKFNIADINVTFPKDSSNKIQLNDEIGIVLKYPTIDMLGGIDLDNQSDIASIFKVMIASLDMIYDKTEVYNAKDHTKEELNEFFDGMNTDQLKKVVDFFNNLPKLKQNVDFTCPKCGKETHTVLEGLSSFF